MTSADDPEFDFDCVRGFEGVDVDVDADRCLVF